MIFSSADILSALGGDAIIRQECRLSIVEGRPGLGIDEYVYIYIDRYPTVEDFEATWKIWVINAGSDLQDLVLNAMTTILPNFTFNGNHYTTTDFASDKTVIRSEADLELEATRREREELKKDFSGLSQGLEARLSTVRDGRDGVDGRDGLDGRNGKDGRDGQDGRDLVATEAELFDLTDVEQGIQMERGQVLTWDGTKWTNLYVRQVLSAGGSAGGVEKSPVQVVGTTIRWRYHSTSHEIEPDPRDFHSNSSSGDEVTVFHVSDFNSSNSNVEALIRELLSSSYSRLYVSSANDPSQAHLYQITSYNETSSGFEIFVTHMETVGPEPVFVQPNNYDFLFLPPTASDLDVTSLYQLIGVPQGDTDLGTFAGELIPDNASVKVALQSIETYLESQPPNLQATPYNFGNDQTPPSNSGKLEMDGATFGATTELYLNKINRDGKDLTNVIPEITQEGSRIYIQLDPSAAEWVSFDQVGDAIDNGGYFTFNVTYVDSSDPAGMFSNNAKITFGVFSTGTGGSGGIEEAPADGNYYVRQNNVWVNLNDALTALGVLKAGDNINLLTADTGASAHPAEHNALVVDKSDGSIVVVSPDDTIAPEDGA